MITGKYWITPKAVVDVTVSEHALFAKKVMLGLHPDDPAYNVTTMFKPLSAVEMRRYRKRGVGPRILNFLSTPGNDPRVYVIRHWQWIRTRQSSFYLWALDRSNLRAFRNAAAFWDAQRYVNAGDVADVIELSTDSTCVVPIDRLRRRSRAAGRPPPHP
jgi:hypothetical protein